jgi:hypothetical protein
VPRPTLRPLFGLAWLNVFLHLLGLLLAATSIRPGSALMPLEERLGYLEGMPAGWTMAWVAWILCAASLITFLALVTRRLGEHAGLAQFGLMIAVVGAACDLFCDSVYMLIFPMLASWKPPPETLFLTLERMTGIASLVIANGAYSLAILLVTQALRERRRIAPFTVGVGYAVAGFGILLAAAGFTGVPWHAEWATLPTIGLFCLWVVLVAGALEPARRSS